MRLGYGWAAGPFQVVDNAGLDTFVLIDRFLRAAGEDDLLVRSDLVERLAQEGRLGRKVGKGFYDYTPRASRFLAAKSRASARSGRSTP